MKRLLFIFLFFLNFENSLADNKIVYIDVNYILNNSIVGKLITTHINKIKENKNNELLLIKKKLSDKETNIIKKKNIVDKNELQKEINILNEEINKYKKQKIIFKKEIDDKKLKYSKIVLNAINPIISKYVEENSITIVLSKQNIIIAKNNLDITNQIMDLLNIQLTKIDF